MSGFHVNGAKLRCTNCIKWVVCSIPCSQFKQIIATTLNLLTGTGLLHAFKARETCNILSFYNMLPI